MAWNDLTVDEQKQKASPINIRNKNRRSVKWALDRTDMDTEQVPGEKWWRNCRRMDLHWIRPPFVAPSSVTGLHGDCYYCSLSCRTWCMRLCVGRMACPYFETLD